MMATLLTALLWLQPLTNYQPGAMDAAAEAAPQVDLRLRLVQFQPSFDLKRVPVLSSLGFVQPESEIGNPEGTALASIPGVTMNRPIHELFVDKDHYTLNCRGTDIDVMLRDAAKESDSIQFLSAPRLLVLAGQQASVRVGQPVHYLERGLDGCLRVGSDDELSEGIAIDLLVGEASADRIAFNEIKVRISEVVSRQTLEGVPFDVGRPTIASRVAKMQLSLNPEQVGVFPVPRAAEDDLPILLFLTAELVDDKTTSGGR